MTQEEKEERRKKVTQMWIDYLLVPLEEFILKLGIKQKFLIGGFQFGAYVCAQYTMRNPD